MPRSRGNGSAGAFKSGGKAEEEQIPQSADQLGFFCNVTATLQLGLTESALKKRKYQGSKVRMDRLVGDQKKTTATQISTGYCRRESLNAPRVQHIHSPTGLLELAKAA